MDSAQQGWFNKLESKIDDLTQTTIKEITALTTTLNIYLPRQDDHEKRINTLEDKVTEIETNNSARSKNHNILLGIGTIVATIAAVIIGILVDRYLFKGGG